MFDCLVDVDSALNNSINVKWFKDDEVSFYVVACPDLSQLAVNNMQQWHSAAVAQCIATKEFENVPIFCSDWLLQVAAHLEPSVN